MTRHLFPGDLFLIEGISDTAKLGSSVSFSVWTARTGGSNVTAACLADNGTSSLVPQADLDGKRPYFYGPDTTGGIEFVVLYIDAGIGERYPVYAVDSLTTAALGGGGGGGVATSVPSGVAALVDRLRFGVESGSVLVLGDSTGNNNDEWFYLALIWLGAQFPAYSVTHTAWNDTLQAWDPSDVISGVSYQQQFGTAGDAYVSGTWGASDRLSTPDVAALRITGDLDVRVKARAVDWSANPRQSLTSKFGGGGNRGWQLLITPSGALTFEASQDGTALISATSSAAVPFADNTDGWVRAVFTAATSKVDFYTSNTGISWTALGTQQTLTGITAIFPCTQTAEIGCRFGGGEPFIGRIYYVEWRAAGVPKLIVDFDSAIGSDAALAASGGTFSDSLGRTWTRTGALAFAGSPGLFLFNGCVPGQVIAYSNDGTRGPLQRAILPPDLAFISYSHNESVTAYRSPFKTLADAIIAAFPDVGIVAVTQNPQTAVRTALQIAAHASRNRQIVSLAGAQRYGLADAYAAFLADSRGLAALVSSDGIHPLQAGNDLWRDTVKELFPL